MHDITVISNDYFEEIWEFGILKSSQLKITYLLLSG